MNFVSSARILFTGLCLFAASLAGAAEQKPTLHYDQNRGIVIIYHAFPNPAWGSGFKVSHFDGSYKPMKDFIFDGSEQEGRLITADGSRVPVKIQCTKKSATELSAKLSVESAQPFSSSRLMYEQNIRYEDGVGIKVTVNGQAFDFSQPFDPKQPYQKALPAPAEGGDTTVTVEAPKASWTITGKFSVILQDMRKWNQNVLQLRLMFTPYSGMLTNADLEFNLVLVPKAE